ncbi:unnamed protein product [Ixodes persulcatus]
MLEPSSSEEEGGSDNETVEDESSEATILSSSVAAAAAASGSGGGSTLELPRSVSVTRSLSPSVAGETLSVASGVSQSRSNSLARPSSPSPSLVSEKDDADRAEREEEERKKRLQLYVFVLRTIAYPFNAKQPTDMTRRQTKITKQQLDTIQARFQAFLKGETQIAADEAFQKAVQSYQEVFLRSDRVQRMVASGACSGHDFREVFRNNVDKRVRSLPEIDGLSKETVLSSWMTKFDAIFRGDEDTRRSSQHPGGGRNAHGALLPHSELLLSKEQLYDMFQGVLGVKKFEHQLLYNALQVRPDILSFNRGIPSLYMIQPILEFIKNKKQSKKCIFVSNKSSEVTVPQQKSNLLQLSAGELVINRHLGNPEMGNDKKTDEHNKSFEILLCSSVFLLLPISGSVSPTLITVCQCSSAMRTLFATKLSTSLDVTQFWPSDGKSAPFNVCQFFMEVLGATIYQTQYPTRKIFSKAWLSTTKKTPHLKADLHTRLLLERKPVPSFLLSSSPHRSRSLSYFNWHRLALKWNGIQQSARVTAAPSCVQRGQCFFARYLYAQGKQVWKKWKKRYFVLVQVSQYTFAMCSFREKTSVPTELLQLDGYTVDYTEAMPELEGGRFFFNAVKEGDSVAFASEDENECHLWVMAMYRATGQSHKPTPLVQPLASKNSTISRMQGDTERARKHGMDEFISADPNRFDHHMLFRMLQTLTLDYRLNDPYCSLGWFSPGQVFALDEYAARYCVRSCFRHLCYLHDLLNRAEKGVMIDPTLIHYSFAFCSSHVHGNSIAPPAGLVVTDVRPDGIGTVTVEEKDMFAQVKERLRILLEHQITHFRYCFPFGRPEGALKATLSLLERVLMKDVMTPAPPEEVRAIIKKCLENAALVNYTRISEQARLQGDQASQELQDQEYHSSLDIQTSPGKRLEELIHLAELCVDLLQQNNEHYSEAFAWFSDLLVEHAEIFWSLFAVDMDSVLDGQPPDTWDSFPLLQVLNDYLRIDENLCGGRFHQHLRDKFAPQVVRYVDLMESSIHQSLLKGLEKERWELKGNGCPSSEELFWKLDALQSFIRDLHWPDEEFAKHLEQRLKIMACEDIDICISRTLQAFQQWQRRGSKWTSTDYIVPSEMCAMINVALEARTQSLKLCTVDGADLHQCHSRIDSLVDGTLQEMQAGLIGKLTSILEATLGKLSRYDEGSLLAPILSLTYRQGMSSSGKEVGHTYVNFVRNSMEQLRQKVSDELWVLALFEQWYAAQMSLLCSWLSERLDHGLHSFQLSALLHIARKLYSDFELQGIEEEKLNSKVYQTVCSRLQLEEAAASVSDSSREKDDSEDYPETGVESDTRHKIAAALHDSGDGAEGYVTRIQNVTQNVTGRISTLARGVGGFANKFSGGFLNF